MRSLFELLENEHYSVARIENETNIAGKIRCRIEELKANPYDCEAKLHDIEREYELLREYENSVESERKNLAEIRKGIREYLMVLMNGDATTNL